MSVKQCRNALAACKALAEQSRGDMRTHWEECARAWRERLNAAICLEVV